MIVGEEGHVLAFQVHHAGDTVLRHQRNGDFGANIRMRGDVARVLAGILHPHRGALLDGRAGDALAQRYVVQVHALVVTDAEAVAQQLPFGIHQQDVEGVVINQAAHRAGDLGQQLVDVQDRRKLLRNGGQGFERAVLSLDAAVEAGIIDRDGHSGGDQAQQGAVVFGVRVRARGLDVDDAHQLAARDHGDGQFGAHGFHGVQVAGVAAHVSREHRFLCERGGPGNALPERNRPVPDHFLAMADGVTNT